MLVSPPPERCSVLYRSSTENTLSTVGDHKPHRMKERSQVSKIKGETQVSQKRESVEIHDPSGIRTHALSPLKHVISGGFPLPLNALTGPSTASLPPDAPDPTATEVRSEGGAALSLTRVPFADLPLSSLLRLAARLVELMAPTIEQDAALIVAFRAAADRLEVTVKAESMMIGDRDDADSYRCAFYDALSRIGEVRS